MYYGLMRIFLGIMIGIITLIGTSNGEVGESIQQIKNKQGPLEKVNDELLRNNQNNDQASYPNKQIFSVISDILMQYKDLNAYLVKKPKNFDAIIYFFFNNKNIPLNTCVLTAYLKLYQPRQVSDIKDHDDPYYFPPQLDIPTVNEVEAILTTNSSCFSKNKKIIYSENVKNGIGYAPWRMQWSCLGGQIVDASVGDCGNFGYLKLFCISKELVDFSQKQEKQKNNDSLPEGIWDNTDYEENFCKKLIIDIQEKINILISNITYAAYKVKVFTITLLQKTLQCAQNINPFRLSTASESDFETQTINDGISITKYIGSALDLIVPEKLNGVNVVEIGQKAFSEKPIRSIRLPVHLKRVGPKAFLMCKELNSVFFNKEIKEIGSFAFSGCNLVRLQLPNNISIIGSSAFSWNLKMRSVTVSGTFAGGHGVFDHCILLSDVSLPEGMTNIPSGLFANCRSLKRVKLPEGVNTIGNSAFLCSGLEQVPWPNSIQHVEPAAFAYCTNLTSISIPNSITNISGLFQHCNNINQVDFPNTLNEIGWGSFTGCEKLKKVIFNGATICEGAFSHSGLETVNIENCEQIGKLAFAGCSKLVEIKMGKKLKKIHFAAFLDCQSLASVTIPMSVDIIDDYAFKECRELTNVNILGNNTKIMPNAFFGCIKLKEPVITR